MAEALVLVSAQHPACTRHDLLKQPALVLPAETRQMNPEEAQELLFGLAEEALSGRSCEVVCLEAPEWPPLPPSLRRELDGRSIYARLGVARYATAAQLSMEERLVAHAHAQTQAASRVPRELAARRLGADLAQLRAELVGRANGTRGHAAPRGLRLDQAAAAWHALTSSRTVEVITGPAGTGKTRVQAMADQQEWEQATARSRQLAIAADAELRRRHPDRKIEPPRSAEPAPVGDVEHQHPDLIPHQRNGETTWTRDLKLLQQTFQTGTNERSGHVPDEDAARGGPAKHLPPCGHRGGMRSCSHPDR